MLIPIGIFGSPGCVAGAYELISTQVLGTAAASVTFSSIPSTYRHLQIRATAKTTTGNENDALVFTFNGDTGANYAFHGLYGTGSTVLSNGATGVNYGNGFPIGGDGASANIFGSGVLDILDYAQTSKNTTTRGMGGVYSTSTGAAIRLNSSLWLNTAAVSSVTLKPPSGAYNLKAGSRFSLYGIKG